MSRRPRAPLALRGLQRQPSRALSLTVPSPSTARLPAPPGEARGIALAPIVETRVGALGDGAIATTDVDFRPSVDTAPVTLRTAVYALRATDCSVDVGPSRRTALLAARGGRVPVLPPVIGRRALPAPLMVLRPAAGAAQNLDQAVLRQCLISLYRSSGAASPSELALLGIYPRVPAGAIDGVTMSDRGLQLHLRKVRKPRAGMLVVGRLRASGALVTAEVDLLGESFVASARNK